MPEVRISRMTAADVPAVAQLEKACFSMPWSEKSIAGELKNEWAVWLIAYMDQQFAGYIGIQYGPDGADIVNVAVEAELRRSGIASALMNEMIRLVRQMSLQWITLEVRESNTPAIRFYEKYGFAEVGRRKNYYEKPRETAILMTKYLTESEVNEHADPGN